MFNWSKEKQRSQKILNIFHSKVKSVHEYLFYKNASWKYSFSWRNHKKNASNESILPVGSHSFAGLIGLFEQMSQRATGLLIVRSKNVSIKIAKSQRSKIKEAWERYITSQTNILQICKKKWDWQTDWQTHLERSLFGLKNNWRNR